MATDPLVFPLPQKALLHMFDNLVQIILDLTGNNEKERVSDEK